LLKEWTLNYLKNRDIVLRRISTIEQKNGYFIVKNKDESHIAIVVKEKIEDFGILLKKIKDLEEEHKADKVTLVIYNSKENFSHLLKNWKKLILIEKMTIIFVNTECNEKWSIVPYIHNRIADPESLETGLKSLFESVPIYSDSASSGL